MKLQTRQEIVDGIKGEIEFIFLLEEHKLAKDTELVWVKSLIFTEPEAKELYELLKERLDGKKNTHHCSDCDNERPKN